LKSVQSIAFLLKVKTAIRLNVKCINTNVGMCNKEHMSKVENVGMCNKEHMSKVENVLLSKARR